MQVSQRALAYMLLWSLACGAGLGLVYDLLAMLRGPMGLLPPFLMRLGERLALPPALRLKRLVKRPRSNNKKREWGEAVLLFWQDVLFCLLFAVVATLLLYYTNDGQWRMGVIVLMLLSLVGYRATMGRPMRFVLLLLRMLMSSLLAWIAAILAYPFRRLWRCLEKPRLALCGYVVGLYRRILLAMEQSKQKRRARRQSKQTTEDTSAPPAQQRQRKPPDGKRVFASGGQKT
jgi:hypothetical protein